MYGVFQTMPAQSKQEQTGGDDTGGVALVGFRIAGTSHADKTFYILVIYNSINIVATINGRIVFFDDARLAPAVLDLAETGSKYAERVPSEAELVCDPHGVIQAVLCGGFDDNSHIVNFINILTDMLFAVGLEIPAKWRTVLFDFADHLTFDQYYAGFFEEREGSRELVKDALLWCVGTVVVNSTLLCRNDGPAKL